MTPLHALIGPNDSGKSTLLEALRAISAGSSEEKSELTAVSGERSLSRVGPNLFPHLSDVDPSKAALNVVF